MRVTAVIPAYNEKDNLRELTRRLIVAFEQSGLEYEILYVIQGNDGSKELLDTMKQSHLRYLYHESPIGAGGAFLEGFHEALKNPEMNLALTMDADLNHQPEELPRFFNALREKNADITIGSRYIKGGTMQGMPLWKNWLSRLMNIFISIFSRIKLADKTSGYRLYKRKVIEHVVTHIHARNFEFYPEVILSAHKAGFTFAEVPITFKFRVHGKSKMRKLQTIIGYLQMFARKFKNRKA
jgi:dolichol-phosphate mannosyltransferase